MLNNGAKWYNFSPPRWSFIAPPLTIVMEHDPRVIANEFIKQGIVKRPLTHMQVQKLVYYAHAWMLGIYDEPLIDDVVETWQYGPVIPTLYDSLRRHGGSPIKWVISGVATEELTEVEMNVITQVYNVYGGYSGAFLSAKTHQPGTPWHTIYQKHGAFCAIPPSLIQDYIKDLISKR